VKSRQHALTGVNVKRSGAQLAYLGEFMKKIQLLFWITIVATASCSAQNQNSTAAPVGNAQSPIAVTAPEMQSTPIRILTPTPGQTLSANFVNLHFELVTPALSGEPNFLVQLDAADPVNTTSTDYTFPELQPGTHNIRVTLIDANGSPVQGGSATVQFKVPSLQPAHKDGSRGAKQHASTVAGNSPAAPIPPELRNEGDPVLPLAGSPLPLLSLIGFGLLIGGAAQAMRSK